MNKQAEENKGASGRPEDFTNNTASKPRRFAWAMCILFRALLKVSQSKNEESGEGWRFPKEILPDLDSPFLRSKMYVGGSIILLPS